MNDKALGAIILRLRDKVLREVAKETSVVAMWTILDSLYMTKSLAHKQYLKQQLYFYHMVDNKSVVSWLSSIRLLTI
jgi:hypothetical protein